MGESFQLVQYFEEANSSVFLKKVPCYLSVTHSFSIAKKNQTILLAANRSSL
jgi:hypothetical protein